MATAFVDTNRASLHDAFGRRIDYLRLSVTDRCDLRCTYCMGDDMRFMPRKNLLTSGELVGIAQAFIDRGIRRIRLTGGEPLTRKDIGAIARAIGARIGNGLDELTMTTNGTQLSEHADALADAGVRRLNVSLDTLDPALFARISRRGQIAHVLAGIDAAVAAGLSIRINMVAMAGVNDQSLLPMADWCEAKGFDLALIETMPMGDVGAIRSSSHVALDRFIAPLTGGHSPVPLPHRSAGPARYVSLPGRSLRLGLITPLSHNFCASCNRVRMSADGKVHGCLGHDAAIDLAGAWRSGGRGALDPLINRLMATKSERHDFAIGPGLAERGPARFMSATGG